MNLSLVRYNLEPHKPPSFYLYLHHPSSAAIMMCDRNPGLPFSEDLISNVHINYPAVVAVANAMKGRRALKKEYQAAWLMKAVSLIDLTTLAGDDTTANVFRLCHYAKHPVRKDVKEQLGFNDITTAAVCVYPSRVADARAALKQLGCNIPVASVAAGFPEGQTPLETRIREVELAVEAGAMEIDIVINRTLVLEGRWEELYDEVKVLRKACGEAHLKTIIATGHLADMENVYKASMISMMAGSDFIKTSTGKESVNATFPVALIMTRAIKHYHEHTGFKVGFKPAGGIRTAKDSLQWLVFMKEQLGEEWLHPHLFRMGASSLLGDIERQLHHYCTGRYANNAYDIGMHVIVIVDRDCFCLDMSGGDDSNPVNSTDKPRRTSRPRSIKRKKHEDPDATEPVLPTKLIVTERLTRRVRRSPNPKQTLLPQTTWSAKDDLKLVLAVQQCCDLAMVHKCVKFSQKHTYQEIEERWYQLLYIPEISNPATAAIANLTLEEKSAIERKALWSSKEEAILQQVEASSQPKIDFFASLLHQHPLIFYPARKTDKLPQNFLTTILNVGFLL
eukprot:sb/3463509/